ncbi:MAG: hypothetical protein LKF71_00160 [Oscillospiraceae bacterium]|jgi:uncharacterized protein YecT (DUF1311 family)|nr:hypothetical protein [Oscillospiraceae bacterium]
MNNHHPSNNKWLALVLCLCVAAVTAGCGQKNAEVSSSSATQSEASSSVEESSGTAQSAGVASGASQSVESAVSKSAAIGETPASGAVSSAPTKDAAFNKKWTANPIDAAFSKAEDAADSTSKIVKMYSDFTDRWQQEIAAAYDRLMTVSGNDAALKNEQTTWVNGKEESIKKIKDSVASGSNGAAIAVANKTMQFYRGRAQQIYYEIYKYDPNFSFSSN